MGGGGIAAWGQKWVGFTTIVTQATGAFNAATNAMRSYVEEYADMAEHMADVTKYTGLAKEDVDELNESFKKMDTRTSRKALNDLAAKFIRQRRTLSCSCPRSYNGKSASS